jgi:hypothetical protein
MSHGDEKHITKLLADQVKKQEHDRKAQAAHVPISKAEYLAAKRINSPETAQLQREIEDFKEDLKAAEEIINNDLIVSTRNYRKIQRENLPF